MAPQAWQELWSWIEACSKVPGICFVLLQNYTGVRECSVPLCITHSTWMFSGALPCAQAWMELYQHKSGSMVSAKYKPNCFVALSGCTASWWLFLITPVCKFLFTEDVFLDLLFWMCANRFKITCFYQMCCAPVCLWTELHQDEFDPSHQVFSVGKWFTGNLSHVTEYCWIFFFSVLSMQHICFFMLFPFLFDFLRKLNLFLWVRRNQNCILLMYVPELSTAAMWTGSKAVMLLYNIVQIACRLALCCECNAVF